MRFGRSLIALVLGAEMVFLRLRFWLSLARQNLHVAEANTDRRTSLCALSDPEQSTSLTRAVLDDP